MRETTIATIDTLLSRDDHGVLILTAPNYEARSISFLLHFANKIDTLPRTALIGMFTLQSARGRVEPLEHLKRLNVRTSKQIFEKCKVRYQNPIIGYPDNYSMNSVRNSLEGFFLEFSSPITIIYDISSMPGRMIFDTLSVLSEATSLGRINQVYIVYSWPESYPYPRHPTESGEPVLLRREERLSQALGAFRRANVAITLGGQGFHAEQFVSALPPDRSVALYAFLNRDHVPYSLEVLRANTSLFYAEAINSHLYLSIEMGHDKIVHWANQTEMHEDCAYLLAPFGPKPLIVSSWIAMRSLQRQARSKSLSTRTLIDAALLGSHHYGSPYSLGRSGISIFSLEVTELADYVQ